MMSKREDLSKKSAALWPLGAAVLGAFLLLGVSAAPARADSNFERGFQDQLGRIAAYETVALGKQILFQGVVRPYHTPHYGYRPLHVTPRPVKLQRPPYRGRGPQHDHWRPNDRDRHAQHWDGHDRYCRLRHRH